MILWILTGTFLFAGSAMTTGAYLTKTTKSLKNILTPGNVLVELKEPGWKDGDGNSMLPAESRTKNPMVKNIGTVDAWVFLEVEIPVRKIALVDANTRRKLPEAKTELFRFQVKEDWELLKKSETAEAVKYVYGYRKLVPPLQETTPLFDKITIVPYLEGSLSETEVFRIPIETRAIQKNIAPEGTGLKEIYQQYLNQEQKTGGNEQA